jgi:hypothetical protein
MVIRCEWCKKWFKWNNDKTNRICPECEGRKKSLKDNSKKVHLFKDAQVIIEETKMSESYGKLSIQRDFSTSAGKPSVLKNVIKIPVVLAAEMVQWYLVSELPQWLQDQYPKDKMYIAIFKPFEELEKAIDSPHKIPACINHPKGTFLKDQNPYDFEMNNYVKEEEVIAWIKDFWADPTSRSIKGFAYITISKAPDNLLERLLRGDIIDVSIGFGATFGSGGEYINPEGWGELYELKQENIKLGHLAILLNDEGKCTIDKCGLNHDHKILIEKDKKPHFQKDGSVMGHIVDFVDSKVQVKFKINQTDQAVVLNTEKDIQLDNTPNIADIEKIGNDLMTKTELELLKEKYAELADTNKKLAKSISQMKTTELSTQLKDTNDELKITASALKKSKADLEELNTKHEAQSILFDKRNSEDKTKLIEKIANLKIDGYSAEELKDETLCDLKKIERIADKVYSNNADKNLAANGLRKPSEADYEANHSGENKDEKKLPSTSFNMNDLRKKRKEKKE